MAFAGLACSACSNKPEDRTVSGVPGSALGSAPTGAPKPSASLGPMVPPDGTVVDIETNTQATLDDLKIGVGNIRESAYANDAGAQTTGLTAALFLSMLAPREDRTVRMHPGMKVDIGTKSVEMRSVEKTKVVVNVTNRPKP